MILIPKKSWDNGFQLLFGTQFLLWEKGNVNVERRKKSCGLRFNVQYQYELKYI